MNAKYIYECDECGGMYETYEAAEVCCLARIIEGWTCEKCGGNHGTRFLSQANADYCCQDEPEESADSPAPHP